MICCILSIAPLLSYQIANITSRRKVYLEQVGYNSQKVFSLRCGCWQFYVAVSLLCDGSKMPLVLPLSSTALIAQSLQGCSSKVYALAFMSPKDIKTKNRTSVCQVSFSQFLHSLQAVLAKLRFHKFLG